MIEKKLWPLSVQLTSKRYGGSFSGHAFVLARTATEAINRARRDADVSGYIVTFACTRDDNPSESVLMREGEVLLDSHIETAGLLSPDQIDQAR